MYVLLFRNTGEIWGDYVWVFNLPKKDDVCVHFWSIFKRTLGRPLFLEKKLIEELKSFFSALSPSLFCLQQSSTVKVSMNMQLPNYLKGRKSSLPIHISHSVAKNGRWNKYPILKVQILQNVMNKINFDRSRWYECSNHSQTCQFRCRTLVFVHLWWLRFSQSPFNLPFHALEGLKLKKRISCLERKVMRRHLICP